MSLEFFSINDIKNEINELIRMNVMDLEDFNYFSLRFKNLQRFFIESINEQYTDIVLHNMSSDERDSVIAAQTKNLLRNILNEKICPICGTNYLKNERYQEGMILCPDHEQNFVNGIIFNVIRCNNCQRIYINEKPQRCLYCGHNLA